MKTRIAILSAASAALLLAAVGCSKQETPPPTTSPPPTPPPQSARQSPPAAPAPVVDTAAGQTTVVQQPTAPAAATAQPQVDAAAAKVQSLVDQARKLVTDKKWSEALAMLNQLSGQKLSTEQQSLVQTLKEQAQKALETAAKAKAAEEATKAVGNLLQPKP